MNASRLNVAVDCNPSDLALPHQLLSLAEEGREAICPPVSRVNIGLATCGRAAGALAISQKLAARQDWEGVARVASVGCLGACYAEPLVDVRTPDGKHYFYGQVDSNSLWRIIRAAEGSPSSVYLLAVARERQTGVLRGVQDLELIRVENSGFVEFFRPQVRRVSGRCGLVDPESLAEYVATGGYFALARALFQLQPKDIIAMVAAAGLRGRGGAGFPTGKKWELVSQSSDPVRIVVANADEGDPGAYMDRALLESDPHGVLEGLILASYAVGASQAYVFVRHEYPLAVRALRQAIASARKAGLLGQHILGSDFSLEVTLVESAGAFVCGEETSMLQVMEGKRGEPYRRPPYPSTRGLWGHPTVINNVETLANIPWIVLNGAEAFREVGTEKSPGTKIFCLAGDVKR
ncbi:MAG: NADH-quinone oxidoreductase subunit F, partial [Clostridia bacterium]|nr:NADH-quinone oxidoreductase subunit F [Clostridia bacterium]